MENIYNYKESEGIIPKKVHLTCKNKNNIDNDPIWIECVQKYREMYKDYEIILYDNDDIYNIIHEHYPEHLEKIKQIKIGAVLADIFRYLIIYLYGGIYSDMDCEPIKNIESLFNEIHFHHYENSPDNIFQVSNVKDIDIDIDTYCDNCKQIDVKDTCNLYECNGHFFHNKDIYLGTEMDEIFYKNKHFQICQWFFISKAKHPLFLEMYYECIKNIDILINLNKDASDYQHIVLTISGPVAFTQVVKKYLPNDNICILPVDFFCSNLVMNTLATKNSYVKHNFTGSWK